MRAYLNAASISDFWREFNIFARIPGWCRAGGGVEISTLHKVGVFAIILNSQTRMALNERGEMPERSNGAAC